MGVFACYVWRRGQAFIDRALYLQKDWTDDPERLKTAHVPDDVGFATKAQIARRMIEREMAAKVPFSFVAADSVYGTGDIESALRKAGKGYVLGVDSNDVFILGARSGGLAGRRERSRRIFHKTPGGACRRAKEPRGRACMTGPISNWPISMPANTTAFSPGRGREAF